MRQSHFTVCVVLLFSSESGGVRAPLHHLVVSSAFPYSEFTAFARLIFRVIMCGPNLSPARL